MPSRAFIAVFLLLGAVLLITGYWIGKPSSSACEPKCYYVRSGTADIRTVHRIFAVCRDRPDEMEIGDVQGIASGIDFLHNAKMPICHEQTSAVSPSQKKAEDWHPVNCPVCYEWHNAVQLWQWHGEGKIEQFPTVFCDKCKP